jgi:short-subunit dehydrogenase
VLINNAGVTPIGGFLEQSGQTIRTSIEVNFCGVLTDCRLVARQAYEQRARAATGVVGSEDA